MSSMLWGHHAAVMWAIATITVATCVTCRLFLDILDNSYFLNEPELTDSWICG